MTYKEKQNDFKLRSRMGRKIWVSKRPSMSGLFNIGHTYIKSVHGLIGRDREIDETLKADTNK